MYFTLLGLLDLDLKYVIHLDCTDNPVAYQ